MITILSPAKNMTAADNRGMELSEPCYMEKTRELAEILKAYSPWQLESLMKINPQLALKAFWDYKSFESGSVKTAAVLSYQGLAYKNLNAQDFSLEDLYFANDSLRILSAFYGVLKPLDGISPYRLEFQCKFKANEKSLYAFWQDCIYRKLFETGEPVINLASNEYSKAVCAYASSRDEFITCDFLSVKRGKLITLPAFAKMARGQMAGYIIKNRIKSPEAIKNFTGDGFEFADKMSAESRYVFVQSNN